MEKQVQENAYDISTFSILLKERKYRLSTVQATDAMIADYMTKPLVGTKFIHFREQIMNSK